MNSWEDTEFLEAVRATGRRKLIFCALWTEVCMAFTALDAMREGYEAYPVVDAIGGTSVEAHRAGLERVVRAGGQPISWVSLAAAFSDRRVPFDASELVFCVTDMSVTLTGCPGGSADERFGPGGPSSVPATGL